MILPQPIAGTALAESAQVATTPAVNAIAATVRRLAHDPIQPRINAANFRIRPIPSTAPSIPSPRPRPQRRSLLGAAIIIGCAASPLGGCGSSTSKSTTARTSAVPRTKLVDSTRPPYITGLAVDPAGQGILLATNAGLFRVSADGRRTQTIHARILAEGHTGPFGQRVSSLAFLDSGHLLGSGHPNPGPSRLPAFLGLIESTNGGRSWTAISRAGFSDLHVLLVVNGTIYGYDTVLGGVVVSTDRGRTFAERSAPGGAVVVDMAVDPHAPRYLLASTPMAIFRSDNQGRSWHETQPAVESRMAWTPNGLFRADADGTVLTSSDRGLTWRRVGRLPRAPGKLVELPGGTLYAALIDGSIVASRDGGRMWKTLFAP